MSRALRWRPGPRLLALVGYALLALAATYPLGLHLGTQVVGRHGDVEEYLWSFWWMRRAALELGANPFFTNWLYYPTGVSLYFFASNPLHAFLSVPLQGPLGLLAAYNIVSLLTFVAAGYTMNRLAYDITRDHAAAFVAGVVFAFAPTQVFHFNVGQPNLYAVEFLPLAILCLRRWLGYGRPTTGHRPLTTDTETRRHGDAETRRRGDTERADHGRPTADHRPPTTDAETRRHGDTETRRRGDAERADPGRPTPDDRPLTTDTETQRHGDTETRRRGLRWLLGAAVALALASLCDWQFAVYLQLFAGLLLLAELLAAGAGWRAALVRLAWRLAAVELLYALAVAPVVLPMLRELGGPEPYMVRSRADTVYHSADLLSFFIPNPAHPLWRGWAQAQIDRLNTDGVLLTVVSVSYVALALAVWGAARRWAQARFWVCSGLLFWSLALGPQLRLGGRVTGIPLPYELLFQLRVIQISRTPGRYFIVALICLAVLAALGVRALRGASDGRRTTDNRPPTTDHRLTTQTRLGAGRWALLVILSALCFELLPAPVLAEPPAPTPAFYTDGTLRGAGAILELPPPANLGMYYAARHGHPVLYAELSRDNPPGPLLDYLRGGLFREEIIAAPDNWACAAGFYGITHLVGYRYGQADPRAAVDQLLERLGPQALVSDAPEAALFRSPPAAPGRTCVVLGAGWGRPRPFGAGQPLYRWTGQQATLALLRRTPGRVTLRFRAHSFASARQLQVVRAGQPLAQLAVGVDPQPHAVALDLPAGVSWLELRAVEPAQSPADFGYPETDPVAIGFAELEVAEAAR